MDEREQVTKIDVRDACVQAFLGVSRQTGQVLLHRDEDQDKWAVTEQQKVFLHVRADTAKWETCDVWAVLLVNAQHFLDDH